MVRDTGSRCLQGSEPEPCTGAGSVGRDQANPTSDAIRGDVGHDGFGQQPPGRVVDGAKPQIDMPGGAGGDVEDQVDVLVEPAIR
jgi:hypothetical protein